MNCVLKLWTSCLHNIEAAYAVEHGVRCGTNDGFVPSTQIYDGLTMLTGYADAKEYHKGIYTAYVGFKGAFDSTDHEILFKTLTNMVMPTEYIDMCKDISSKTTTSYHTPLGGNNEGPSAQRHHARRLAIPLHVHPLPEPPDAVAPRR